MLTREITYYLDGATGAVTPTVPQYGGIRGEHQCAKLTITVTNGAIDEEDIVRLSFLLGDGSAVSSDILDVTVDGNTATVSYTLPQLLTQTAGQLCARLVLSRMDENGNETVTWRSDEMVVWFEDAALENGTPFWMGVSEMLKRTATAKSEAVEAAKEAKAQNLGSGENCRRAQAAAVTAETASANAVSAASTAVTAKEDAESAASEARSQNYGAADSCRLAQSAARTAQTAKEEAVTAKEEAVQSIAQTKSFSDSAMRVLFTFCGGKRYRGEMSGLVAYQLADKQEGDVFFCNDSDKMEFFVFDGSSWKAIDCVTPYIGENNDWFVGGLDTGVKATGNDGVGVKETFVVYDGETKKPVKTVLMLTNDEEAEIPIVHGEDYVLTEADKADIAEKVPFMTTPAEPLFAAGVSAMTDTAKVYVNTETGTFWRYQETTYEGTLTDVIAMDDADNPAHDGYYVSKGTLTARAGNFVTPYINIGKYSEQIALKVKGTTCLSASATVNSCCDLYDENRTCLTRVYMTLAEAKGANVVTALCNSLDKVTVDGDTTTFIIDLPRTYKDASSVTHTVHEIRFTCGEYGSTKTSADAEISIDYQGTVAEKIWVDTGIAYAPAVTEADKAAIVQEVAAMVDAELLSIIGDGEVVV